MPENARVEALRTKHMDLSRKIEDAQRTLSIDDFDINDLKKQKLSVKEELCVEERRA
ncbi:MAG: YdcH family protein [Alphaproteobacteria bacterium]